MSPYTPDFSFVATSRNDDHGGDVLRRTQSFTERLAEQCERHQVSGELVLVDWNPPCARAPLADVLAWPAGNPWFSARVITVPESLHRQLKYSSRLAMFQMIAKNVGIRRARGAYTIATNIDIIFSDELFRWLKSGVMREGVLYRSDRWDIPNEIQLEADLGVLLERARAEAIRRNFKDGTYVLRDGAFVNLAGNRVDDLIQQPVHKLPVQLNHKLDRDPGFYKDDANGLANDLLSELPKLRRKFIVPQLHTNGCGDFTMLASRDWSMLRGYPEWNIFSWNIDSVLVFQAHYAGLAIEEIGETCVHYHIEHNYGSGWTPEGAASLWARLAARGIPFISDGQFEEIVAKLHESREQGVVETYNEHDWGFAGHEFEIREAVGPDTPRRVPRMVNAGPLDEEPSLKLILAEEGNLLQLARAFAETIRAEHRIGRDGQVEIAVETPAETWHYAVELDRSYLPVSGEYWIRTQVVVESGNIELRVHNRSNTAFLTRSSACGPAPTPQILLAHVPEIGDAGNVIVSNITKGNQPARFRLRALELLHEDLAAAAAKPPSPNQPADKPVDTEPSPSHHPNRRRLSWDTIKSTASNTIVRVLRDTDGSDDGQAIIILAPAAAAVLDLAIEPIPGGRIYLHLHVIEGVAAIGLHARSTGKPIVEHRQGPSPPMTRVSLEADAPDIGSLVISNAIPSGRTTLLLHRVECDG